MDEIVIQLDEYRQLVRFHGVTGEIVQAS
jgi:hypothetical protein